MSTFLQLPHHIIIVRFHTQFFVCIAPDCRRIQVHISLFLLLPHIIQIYFINSDNRAHAQVFACATPYYSLAKNKIIYILPCLKFNDVTHPINNFLDGSIYICGPKI